MRKFEVSEEFVKAAHNAACSDWKRRIEKEIPEAFETVLEVGIWYKYKKEGGEWLVTPRDDYKNTGIVYGFACGKWRGLDYMWTWIGNDDLALLAPATTEEVQEALINEAKKRGYEVGNSRCLEDGKIWAYDSEQGYSYRSNENVLYLDVSVVFKNGKWATIIEEPALKVTQADIEKKFGCKVEIV